MERDIERIDFRAGVLEIIGTTLVVLGGACLALLVLGRWLKALAGEASGLLQRTSEAQFLSLLELGKLRHERLDLGRQR